MREYYKKIKRPIVCCIMLPLGVVIFVFSLLSLWNADLFQYLISPRVLFQTNAEDLENEAYYRADNNEFLDWYAYDDYGRYYVTSIKDRTKSGDYAGYTYMGFYVYEEDFELVDQIMEETWMYYDEEPDASEMTWISGRGYIYKMDSEEKGYFKDWFIENGAPEELMYKLCFKTFYLTPLSVIWEIDGWETVISALAAFISFLCILYSAYRLMYGYKKNVVKFIKKNDLDPQKLANELDSGISFKTAVVSNRFVMGFKPKAFIVKTGDLVWVYDSVMRKSNNSYYNGVHTKSEEIQRVVLVDRSHTKRVIEMSNKSDGDRFTEALKLRVPFLIYGFNQELSQMEQQNFASMIRQVDEKRADGFYV